jgi:hypothetical protein
MSSNDWRPAGLLNRPSHHAAPWSGQMHDNFGSSNTWSITNANDKTGGTIKDRYEALKGYFGEVRHNRKIDLMNETYEKENSDYPEAFAKLYGGGEDGQFDRNGHLERVMIEKTMASKNFYLSRMAPWKLHEGSLDFDWSKTLFTETMLDRLPEESVPRLMTSRATHGRTSMLRYGIALLLEATFAETPQGRQTYIMNLEQMRVACVQTASYGVIVSIMEHQPYVDALARGRIQDGKAEKDFEQIDRDIQDEVDRFGIMHKEAHGVQKVLSEMRKILTNRGKRANFSMFPQGSPIFAAELEGENKFMVTGHATPNDVDRSHRADVTCESHAFNMGDDEPGHDPMFRHRTIGAFGTLDDLDVRDEDVAQYRTKQMDSLMYDQTLDEFFVAKYGHGYRYTGLWNFNAYDSPLTPDMGRGTMYDYGCYTWGQLLRKCTNGSARAVNKIFALPEDKHQAFIDSLRTLHRDSPLVNLRGAPFPSAADFSVIHFDRMDSGAEEEFDSDRPVLISVPEHQAAKATHGSYKLSDIQTRAAYSRKQMTQKRKFAADDDELTNKELFDGNADMGIPSDEAVPDRYERVDVDHVALIPGTSEVQVRKIRRKFDHDGDVTAALRSPDSLAVLATRVEKCVPALASKNSEKLCKGAVASYVEAILKKAASDEQKASLLRELARVTKGVVYTLQFKTRDDDIRDAQAANDDTALAEALARDPAPLNVFDLTRGIVSGFSNFAARIDLRAAIENNSERRALDDKCRDDASISLSHSFDLALVKPYWWSADGDADAIEDGQVCLRSLQARSGPIPLPSDAFASTLTAEHAVLFDIDDEAMTSLIWNFSPVLGEGSLRRPRSDPFIWSMALSAMSHMGGFMDLTTRTIKDVFPTPASHKFLASAVVAANLRSFKRDGKPFDKPEVDKKVADATAAIKAFTPANPFTITVFLKQASPDFRAKLKRHAKARRAAGPVSVLVCQQQHRSYIQQLDDLLVKACLDNASDSVPADPLGSLAASLSSAYASPTQIDVEALALDIEKRKKKSKAASQQQQQQQQQQDPVDPRMTDLTPANATTFTWSKACISDLIDRASVSSGLFLTFCVENDIPVPFCLRVWRPNKCFNMGSALSMQAGRDGAAQTFYQNPNMMMAGNAAQKMIFGHFTLYFKTIVFNPECIVIMRDIYSNAYIGGNGRRSWDPLSQAHTEAYASGDMGVASIFWTFAPMNRASCHWWQTITGEMPEHMPCSPDVRATMRWEGCEAWSEFWGYKTNGSSSHSPLTAYSSVNNPNDRKHNVICIQDFQQKYDPSTGTYSKTVLNKGHWGEHSCYPGAAKVMRGVAKYFDVPSYMPVNKTSYV